VTRQDWRDVDVRVLLDDATFDELARLVSIPRLNQMISLWAVQATGMPVDFQLQRRTDANDEFPGAASRRPLGVRPLLTPDVSELLEGA